jgi:hypothetical protein
MQEVRGSNPLISTKEIKGLGQMPTPSFIGSQQHSQQTPPKTLLSFLIAPLSLFKRPYFTYSENLDPPHCAKSVLSAERVSFVAVKI